MEETRTPKKKTKGKLSVIPKQEIDLSAEILNTMTREQRDIP